MFTFSYKKKKVEYNYIEQKQEIKMRKHPLHI